MAAQLVDLDELVLSTRDRNSRAHIEEAVGAYRAGLYRSATVAAWTTLVYDIISKIRELANQGEPQAIAFVNDLDTAIAAQNVPKVQQIEADILTTAHNPFEFVDNRQLEDLQRLRADRHHCAHPAFVADNLLYVPSPELVRSHLVHVITHVLDQQPVQGKAALEHVKNDILQITFPQDQAGVTTYIYERYLKRGRRSLIETLVVVLLKVILRASDAALVSRVDAVVRTLIAVREKFPIYYEAKMREQLPKLASGAHDDRLFDFLLVIAADPGCYEWLDAPTKIRISEMISRMTFTPPAWHRLAACAVVPKLGPAIAEKFRKLDPKDQQVVIQASPHPLFAEAAITTFADAGGWRTAEARGEKLIIPMAPHLQPAQVAQVLQAVQDNSQIWDAGGMPPILDQFYDLTLRHLGTTGPAWRSLKQFIIEKGREDSYETLLAKIQSAGI